MLGICVIKTNNFKVYTKPIHHIVFFYLVTLLRTRHHGITPLNAGFVPGFGASVINPSVGVGYTPLSTGYVQPIVGGVAPVTSFGTPGIVTPGIGYAQPGIGYAQQYGR